MTEKIETFDYEDVKARRHARLDPVEQQNYLRYLEEVELRTSIAEMVYEGRIRAGLSQTQLAELAGTRQSVISSLENGAQTPQITTLMRIADALNSPLELRIGKSGFVHTSMAS
jgi:ribosome-binding protein aMBF1 (putative translation factor)